MVVESADGVELLLRHSPSPAELDRALAEQKEKRRDGVLLVVARAGAALVEDASQDPRVSYAAPHDKVVPFLGELHHAEGERSGALPRPGRTSWARLGALRLFALVADGQMSQSEVARRIGGRLRTGPAAGTGSPPSTQDRAAWRASGRPPARSSTNSSTLKVRSRSPRTPVWRCPGISPQTSTPLGGAPPGSLPMSSCVLGTGFRSALLWAALSTRSAPRMYSSQRVVQHRYPPRSRWISSTFTAILAKPQQIRGPEQFN